MGTSVRRYPEKDAVRSWDGDEGVVFSIVIQDRLGDPGHPCGYARFPKRPVREEGYRGIMTFVDVHGGITYASEDEDGSMVYGFDCSHSGDWSRWDPTGRQWTEDEVAEQCERMAFGIVTAAKYEEDYLLASDAEQRAEVIDRFHAEIGGFDLTDNFGAMIQVLFGLTSPGSEHD